MKILFKFLAIIFTSVALIGAISCEQPAPDQNDPEQEQPDNKPDEKDTTDNSGIVKLNYEIQSTYQTLHFEELGEYQIILSNTDKINESGMPTEEGGLVYLLYMYNAIDEDPMNASLPSGVYNTGEEKAEWTLYFEHSAAFLYIDGQIVLSTIDGSVKVTKDKGDYTITVDADLPMLSKDEKAHIVAQYTGDLNIIDITTPLVPEIEENVDLEFEAAYGRYFGNFYLPHSDDINLTFTQGETQVSENGAITLVDGYALYLFSVYMPKLENYNTENVVLAEGTYYIDSEKTWLMYSESSLPYLIDRGEYEKNPFGEDYIQVGSYLIYTDKETGEIKEGLLSSGTMEVTHDGNGGYEIIFDFVAPNGINIKGSYTGAFTKMLNVNDNDLQPIMQTRPWTSLQGDCEINFLEGTELNVYISGNYLDPAYDQVILTLAHPTKAGEVIMSQIVVDRGAANSGIPTGKYNVSWDIKPYTIFPGWYSMNMDLLYTWYGDNREESSNLVAISGGHINISKDESDIYTFDIEFTDQAGHKISGSWTGSAIYPTN